MKYMDVVKMGLVKRAAPMSSEYQQYSQPTSVVPPTPIRAMLPQLHKSNTHKVVLRAWLQEQLRQLRMQIPNYKELPRYKKLSKYVNEYQKGLYRQLYRDKYPRASGKASNVNTNAGTTAGTTNGTNAGTTAGTTNGTTAGTTQPTNGNPPPAPNPDDTTEGGYA